MKLAAIKHTLWYENEHGEVWVPPWGAFADPPAGFVYQHSQFPTHLHLTVLRCGADGAREVVRGTAGYSDDLVLAMTRPTLGERVRQVLRYGRPARRATFGEAVLLAANTCERCTNVLRHRSGLRDGYRERSPEWHRAGTSCGRCESEVTP